MPHTSLHLIIKGKVQGVYFRASARDLALQLRLNGWVRNTPDGHVETVVSGNPEQVSQFLDWCKIGPEGSRVDSVTQLEAEHDLNAPGFAIIR